MRTCVAERSASANDGIGVVETEGVIDGGVVVGDEGAQLEAALDDELGQEQGSRRKWGWGDAIGADGRMLESQSGAREREPEVEQGERGAFGRRADELGIWQRQPGRGRSCSLRKWG